MGFALFYPVNHPRCAPPRSQRSSEDGRKKELAILKGPPGFLILPTQKKSEGTVGTADERYTPLFENANYKY